MKKISIVGTAGIPACYGGFESLVENLTLYSNKNIAYSVFCSSFHYNKKLKRHNNAELIYVPLKANGMQSIVYDIVSLMICIFKRTDALLILGVSGCVFLPVFKVFSPKCKIITNIDGLEWKRDKWGRFAKWFLKKSESFAIKYSDKIITDNEAISEYVRNTYNDESCAIAYGGDHALSYAIEGITRKDYFLSLCRIEPENNVHQILSAFSENGFHIKFIGNWNASEYGRKLKEKYSDYQNIEIIDPIYDLGLLYKYRAECIGYVHGHSAGGTNPSLVEIMHFGVPIIAFDCTFNRYTTENKACYFSSVDELNAQVNLLLSNSSFSPGEQMKEIANRRYTWKVIVEEYEKTY
nr:DUF1972 domain-containing protein [uncultured Enterobacter sp.]